jgi:hypothetical protein
MCKHVKFFPSSRFIIILAILSLGFALVACGGSSTKKDEKSAESTGSLTRTYKIVDENGLESGTLTMDPAGGIVLRDEKGEVIGKFTQDTPTQTQQTETQPATQSEEAKPSAEGEEAKPSAEGEEVKPKAEGEE